jgi:hypothetical protein
MLVIMLSALGLLTGLTGYMLGLAHGRMMVKEIIEEALL